MTTLNKRLQYCVLGNAALLASIVVCLCAIGKGDSQYWNIGPNDSLIVINVALNTWTKYLVFLIFLFVFKVLQVIIAEIAHPIIGFNIYNPDKKTITEFSKLELQVYGNAMYLIDGVRNTLFVMVTISQIDIALFGVLVSEITSVYTIRMLLNEKSFVYEEETSQLMENDSLN